MCDPVSASIAAGATLAATGVQMYQAKSAAEKQERYLNTMRDDQQNQIAEMKKKGPAPTMEPATQSESEQRRRAALLKMRAGLQETIKTSPGGVSTSPYRLKPTATAGKTTLGG